MYLIAKACYEIPGFMDIVTTNTYQMPANLKHANPYFIQNTNKMQNRAYPDYYRSYVKGMKFNYNEKYQEKMLKKRSKDFNK